MEFLLVLSALLSAVTGVFTGARPDEARLHHAAPTQSVAAATQSATVAVPAKSTAAALPDSSRRVAADARPAAPLPASVPLYADRLIE
ncbi:MAG TPA: hypothetical protein VGO55_11670 [Allosphingosinicella sp.]|jgi:hypothetical protein|nr:hypothetical protein [Allosphingosinicella sp.]